MRLVGFPAYTYFLLRQMEARHLQVPLRPGSKILLGGGWKQFYTQQVDKPVLYDLVKRVLGLDNRDIIEVFSAVEHPSFTPTVWRTISISPFTAGPSSGT